MIVIRQIITISPILLVTLGYPAIASAQMRFAKSSVDAGTLRTGLRAKFEFPFTVEGDEPLQILELKPGCGCLKPAIEKYYYKPGEKGKITLQVNTLGESAGKQRWYVHVRYRQGIKNIQLALQVHADVTTEVTIQPAKVRVIATAGGLTQEIRLTDLRNKHLTIKAVQSSLKFVNAATTDSGHDELGHWHSTIRLGLCENLPSGEHHGTLHIYTDDSIYGHLQVPIHITRPARNRIRANPGTIKIIGIAGRPLPSRLLAVGDAENEPVEIKKIRADHPAIQCRWAKGPGALATVKIQVDRLKMKSKQIESTIQVYISSPAEEVISIPVTCNIE